jgi:hypothetical protein
VATRTAATATTTGAPAAGAARSAKRKQTATAERRRQRNYTRKGDQSFHALTLRKTVCVVRTPRGGQSLAPTIHIMMGPMLADRGGFVVTHRYAAFPYLAAQPRFWRFIDDLSTPARGL